MMGAAGKDRSLRTKFWGELEGWEMTVMWNTIKVLHCISVPIHTPRLSPSQYSC